VTPSLDIQYRMFAWESYWSVRKGEIVITAAFFKGTHKLPALRVAAKVLTWALGALVVSLHCMHCVAVDFVGPQQPRDALDRWYLRSSAALSKVRYCGGLFIGVGANGLIMTSPDGTAWTQRNSGTTANLRSVAGGQSWTGKRYVAVGDGRAMVISLDGTNWSPVTTAYTTYLNEVVLWDGMFVVSTGWSDNSQPNLLTSVDGTHWNGVNFPPIPGWSGYPYFAAALGGNDAYLVATGSPEIADDIWRSFDGSTWEYVGFSYQAVNGIAFGDGQFVMVGVGPASAPLISTNDAASWFPSDNPLYVPGYPVVQAGFDIAFGNGKFVTVGVIPGGGLLVLSGGTNWQRRDVLTENNLESIAYGNHTFVLAGSSGTHPAGIYQSEPVWTPVLTPVFLPETNAINLQISGEIGHAYQLQASTNLQSWWNRWSFTNTSGVVERVEPINPAAPGFFYRVIGP